VAGKREATAPHARARRWTVRAGLALAAVIITAAVPALRWQSAQSAKTRCQTNQRRLSTALLLYAQDHDGRLPPTDYRLPNGKWRNWLTILLPYIGQDNIAVCPANPAGGARDPFFGYPYPYSYALNSRFFDWFHPGSFPIENLEIPAQTALLVEGGSYRADGPFGAPAYPWATSRYWDMAWWPNVYPSPHNRRMNVAAADGHVVSVKVAHYRPDGHDPLYGRLGGSIYNWNGGHPNGDTGGPPHE
jgi:prepilin-type processing-associated H-X9-DG protein